METETATTSIYESLVPSKESSICCICLEHLDATRQSEHASCDKCEKTFHAACIDEWLASRLRNQRQATCPACRHVMASCCSGPSHTVRCASPDSVMQGLYDDFIHDFGGSFDTDDYGGDVEEEDPESREIDYPSSDFDPYDGYMSE